MSDTSEPVEPAEPAAPTKLDPVLQERLEIRSAAAANEPNDAVVDDESVPATAEIEQVEVMVALVAPPTSEDIDELADLGLTVRSAIGDILTGVVAIDAVERLSHYQAILKIESSTPLQLEDSDNSANADTEEDNDFDVNDLVE